MKIIFRLRESGQTEVNTEVVMKNVPKLIYFTQIYACECPLINIFFLSNIYDRVRGGIIKQFHLWKWLEGCMQVVKQWSNLNVDFKKMC